LPLTTPISPSSPYTKVARILAPTTPYQFPIQAQQQISARTWERTVQPERLLRLPGEPLLSLTTTLPEEQHSMAHGILLHLGATQLRSNYLLMAPGSLRLLLRWPPGARAIERA